MDSLKNGLKKLLSSIHVQNWPLYHGEFLLCLLACLVLGSIIFYGSVSRFTPILQVGLGLSGFYLLLTSYRCLKRKGVGACTFWVGLMLFSAYGSYVYTEAIYYNYYSKYPYYSQVECRFIGRIEGNIESSYDGQYKKILLGLSAINYPHKKEWQPLDHRLQAYVNLDETSYHRGDWIMLTGQVIPLAFVDEDGRLDLRARAISNDIQGRLYDGKVEAVPAEMHAWIKSNSYERAFWDFIYILRQYVKESIEKDIHSDYVSLCQTLLLGGQYNDIDKDIMTAFSYTGLIHILSVSGSHIALLFSLVYACSRFCRLEKRKAIYLALILIAAYAMLVGFSPPVLRASLMGFIMALGFIKGRIYHARQALHITALGLLIYDPMLLYDISFQLSFAATYGLVLLGKFLYVLLPPMPIFIKGALSLSLASQALLIPFQLYYFHFLNPLSLLAAIIVAPILDLVIILLVLVLALKPLLSISIVWRLINGLLRIALSINDGIARLPYSVLWLGIQPAWASCLYLYTWYGLYTYWSASILKKKWISYLSLGCLCVLLVLIPFILHRQGGIRIHTVPISQGIAQIAMEEGGGQRVEVFYRPLEAGKAVFTSNWKTYHNQQILNALHAYGYDKITSHADSSSDWILSYGTKTYALLHGQNLKKTLKYSDEICSLSAEKQELILGTQTAAYLANYEGTYLFFPRFKSLEEIDPLDTEGYVVGFEYVPDIVLK